MEMVFGLTSFKINMLFVISGCDKPKGLAIKRRLEQVTGEEINHGRLYPNLDQLVEQGYVEKGTLDKRTNFYVTTDKGEKVLDEYQYWQDQERHTDTVANPP